MADVQYQTTEEQNTAYPTLICRVPSGWVEMSKSQFLRGYIILRSDPVVTSINDLNGEQRAQFLLDMVTVGDAVMEVTGAYRMNYFIAGNYDPLLHAHIVPRYMTEPEQYRKGLPWLHPGFDDSPAQFVAERDAPLVREIEQAIQKHLQYRTIEKG